jgi:hypothetical protein
MEGLVLPILIFTLVCLALAFRLGSITACQRWWADLRIRRMLQLDLPGSHYTILQDVWLIGHKEPICIDYLVVSVYGLFAIKQVAGSGLISGKPGDARWLRSKLRKEHYFPNPLYECLDVVKALHTLLGLDRSLLNFVLVFTGNVKFSAPMPVKVTRLDGLSLFIEGRDKLLIDFDELPVIVGRIRASRPLSGLFRNPVRPVTS